MHAEIELTQKRVLDLYRDQRSYLKAKPTHFLEDLQHNSRDLMIDKTFSVATAAQINFAAASVLLEERSKENEKG